MRAYMRTAEHNRKISESHMGSKNPMFGKRQSEDSNKRRSDSLKAHYASQSSEERTKKRAQLTESRKLIIYRPYSPERRLKMAESRRGEKCHFWKGGITEANQAARNRIQFKLWREAVYARDKYTCQKCNDARGGNLNAHHLFSFAEYPVFRFIVGNGITLCDSCHTEFHKRYGKSGNNDEQIEHFIGRPTCYNA